MADSATTLIPDISADYTRGFEAIKSLCENVEAGAGMRPPVQTEEAA